MSTNNTTDFEDQIALAQDRTKADLFYNQRELWHYRLVPGIPGTLLITQVSVLAARPILGY